MNNPDPTLKPLTKLLQTKLLDGSVVSTIYLGASCPGPFSMLEMFLHDEDRTDEEFEQHSNEGYWYETALLNDGECRVLRRHKTRPEAICWHEDYIDKVLHHETIRGRRS